MDRATPINEIYEEIVEAGGKAVDRCFQCGKCDTTCPWNLVRPFSMRRLVREASLGLTDVENEDMWRCTTCGKCPQRCPRDVRQIEDMVSLRRVATGYNVFPAAVRPVNAVSGNLMVEGNPLGIDRDKRADWAQEHSIKNFSEGTEYLYFADCYLAYDRRLQKVAGATARVLKAAGVDFGILGTRENCCGESIRKAGDEAAFKKLARENIKTFIDHGVRSVLVSSPHCYHTFKNEYPEFLVNFEVTFITELVAGLVEQGKLNIGGKYPKKVAYHDPCYLGRHNRIYDAPRTLLGAVEGLELVELVDHHDDSLCCGGGGGRFWMETPKSDRFSELRVRQALDAGAQVLATSCPYCIANFEDTRLSLDDPDAIEIVDVMEIVAAAL